MEKKYESFARYFLGVWFAICAIDGWGYLLFGIHLTGEPEGRFFSALVYTTWFWTFLKIVQTFGAYSMLANYRPAFGLILITPISVVLSLFYIFELFFFIPFAVLIVVSTFILCRTYFKVYLPVLEYQPESKAGGYVENEKNHIGAKMETVNASADDTSPAQTNNNSVKKKPKGRVVKILLTVVIVISSLIYVMHFMWINSGSNDWQMVINQEEVRVFVQKTPGFGLMKIKGIGTVETELPGIIKLMRDPGACDDLDCYESRIIEHVDENFAYYTFRYDMDPFKPREYVVLSRFSQNPVTNEILVEYIATPTKVPPNDCCIRVSHMHNTWRFTPLGDGKVEVELIMNTDIGGGVPYFLANFFGPEMIYLTFGEIQKVLNKDEYKNADLGFLDEFASAQ